MTNLPEDQLHEPARWTQDGEAAAGSDPSPEAAQSPVAASPATEASASTESAVELMPAVTENGAAISATAAVEAPLFQAWSQPEPPPSVRVPHLGHLLLLCLLIATGFLLSIAAFFGAVELHLFGVKTMLQASSDIHFLLGTEAVIYLVAFGLALAVFPPFWHKNLFAGLQWNGATAIRLKGRLVSAAVLCFLLAWLNSVLIPSPTNTPIEKMFKTPGAAWLLFGFGVTFAPFFEEMFFRGFLLPAIATASDWIAERINAGAEISLGPSGRPLWPFAANSAAATIILSIPSAAFLAFYWRGGRFAIWILPPYSIALLAVILILAALKTDSRKVVHPFDAKGEPLWSVSSMIVASMFTSIPFAALHAEQTGYGIGPFLLLVGVSLVLCGVRLLTRSLASSTMVHACYNFLLFSLMLIGTGGFKHLDKM